MPPPDHPEFGAMQLLIEGLNAVHAEMLAGDLQDLQIPAVVTQGDTFDMGGDGITGVQVHSLQIFVPEALHEVALQVLDVQAMAPEGPASTPEILATLESEAPEDPDDDTSMATTASTTPTWITALLLLLFLAIVLACL